MVLIALANRKTYGVLKMIFLARLLFISLDYTELGRVFRILHDVPVNGLHFVSPSSLRFYWFLD